jgi:hypothetical protein
MNIHVVKSVFASGEPPNGVLLRFSASGGTIQLPSANCDQLSSRWKVLHAVHDNICYLGRL